MFWMRGLGLLLFFSSVVLCTDDYYKILGVLPDCSAAEVKRAYHRLSLKYHPDKNNDTVLPLLPPP